MIKITDNIMETDGEMQIEVFFKGYGTASFRSKTMLTFSDIKKHPFVNEYISIHAKNKADEAWKKVYVKAQSKTEGAGYYCNFENKTFVKTIWDVPSLSKEKFLNILEVIKLICKGILSFIILAWTILGFYVAFSM